MNQLSIGDKAPDFELLDFKGYKYLLSDIYKTKNVLLVFNIGFA